MQAAVTLQYAGYLAAQDDLATARMAGSGGADDTLELELLLRRASEVERVVVHSPPRRGGQRRGNRHRAPRGQSEQNLAPVLIMCIAVDAVTSRSPVSRLRLISPWLSSTTNETGRS